MNCEENVIRNQKLVRLGYSTIPKGYTLVRKGTKEIIIRKDVVFFKQSLTNNETFRSLEQRHSL